MYVFFPSKNTVKQIYVQSYCLLKGNTTTTSYLHNKALQVLLSTLTIRIPPTAITLWMDCVAIINSPL